MPYGLPDSWGAWAAQRAFRGITKGGRLSSGSTRGASGSHYSYTFSKLILNRPVLDKALKTRSGDLWKVLNKRGKKMLIMAKRQVGVDTGKLKQSIEMSHKRASYGQELKIGSKNKLAYLHHEGTRPHKIVATTAPQLVFMSKGRLIRTQMVNHPGTKPNKYLSDQLYVVADLGRIYKGKSFPTVK